MNLDLVPINNFDGVSRSKDSCTVHEPLVSGLSARFAIARNFWETEARAEVATRTSLKLGMDESHSATGTVRTSVQLVTTRYNLDIEIGLDLLLLIDPSQMLPNLLLFRVHVIENFDFDGSV